MKPAPELRQLTLRLYAAIASGDVAALDRFFSDQDEALLIGTDPDEWWTGHATIVRAFRTQMEEMGGGFPLVAGQPQAYADGNVGWVADRDARFQMPDGTEVPFRLTLVLHREAGTWRIVQQHVSFGLRNEEALGKALTV